jgi:hypothetical protein
LKLPSVLAITVLGAVGSACGDGGNPGPPDGGSVYFCINPGGNADGGPGDPDANPCGQIVSDPNDCPPGCEPVG